MVENRFKQATLDYERWLGDIIELDPDELGKKHKKMKDDPFEFLRASFYRWADLWRRHGVEKAPEVLGVGDLHVENFGTWRDMDGRLAWGINDFDEACPLPYVNDLVRLAVSAALALDSLKQKENFKSTVTAERACDAILRGYSEAVAAPDERRPYVLAEKHGWLRTIVINKMEKKDDDGKTEFDEIVTKLTKKLDQVKFDVPPVAREALLGAFPPPIPSYPKYRIGQRDAGLGSLGRQRFTAVVDDWNGGLIAREAKALAPSAWLWANDRPKARAIWYEAILQNAVRARDPWVRVYQGWVVRRLAPDAGKVKLKDLPPELDEKLLCAMGAETANIHSWSSQPLQDVSADLKQREEDDSDWFRKAVDRMKDATKEDWEDCQKADW